MAQIVKLTEEEVQSINGVKTKYELIKQEFGNIYIQKLNLESRTERAEKVFRDLQEIEGNIAKALQDKYGKGTVNVETGEFTSLP